MSDRIEIPEWKPRRRNANAQAAEEAGKSYAIEITGRLHEKNIIIVGSEK